MNKFIGRKEELASLEALYRRDGFQMVIIYGRRRTGKSTLISEFVRNKNCIHFTATRSGIEKNIERLGKQVLEHFDDFPKGLEFKTAESVWETIGQFAAKERLVLVIDELPYLAEASDEFISVLQYYIDSQWMNTQLYLILCGSSVSFMEDEVLSEKSPIYGRRTSQIRLRPFDYLEAAEFVPDYSPEDKALCYGITGGVAKYLSLIDDTKSIEENIILLFFSKTGFFYEEPGNLLNQEFRNVSLYSDILDAIASGVNRPNEIADRTHYTDTVIAHALKTLQSTDIISRVCAITDESNKKKTIYCIDDGMLRFWYRFIPDAIDSIEAGRGESYFNHRVKSRISEYMGEIFERMCRSYTLKEGLDFHLNCMVSSVGKWWGTNPKTKKQTDIDVVGLDKGKKQAVLGECKYRNELFDKTSFDELLERNGLIDHKYEIVQYLLFSKGGFSDWLKSNADPEKIKLVDLKDMYYLKCNNKSE